MNREKAKAHELIIKYAQHSQIGHKIPLFHAKKIAAEVCCDVLSTMNKTERSTKQLFWEDVLAEVIDYKAYGEH